MLPSLFQEEIEDEAARQATWTGATENSWPESQLAFSGSRRRSRSGPHKYLELVRRASEVESTFPVIASLNGITKEGWIEYARLIQQAGAKGLELNIYFIAADTSVSGAEVERRYLAYCPGGPVGGDHSVGGKTQSLFQLPRPYGAGDSGGRRRCAGVVQPLLSTGYRSRAPCRC